MKYLYVVRDVKAGDVGDQVMLCRTDAVAVRAFTDALKNPQNFMSRYAEDYELLEIGAMSETGHLEIPNDPRVVLTGKSWKLSQETADVA